MQFVRVESDQQTSRPVVIITTLTVFPCLSARSHVYRAILRSPVELPGCLGLQTRVFRRCRGVAPVLNERSSVLVHAPSPCEFR